ncbi:STAS domain-containing protein [Mycolicibacterium sp. 050232]|uniref:STAS domain-containing protein n=1 Tax=Mycolicibacterium sp. 050232 TaxID=3113982 RepID=UPI002E2D8A56|nr:STAS domain-containing protein [Mycolicibacterium sp. 050232]MED5816410.1 STAS domain-containing protein [Mycolicibacterium sp. 050232]
MAVAHYFPDRLRPVRSTDSAVIDCAGARVSAYVRGPATVLVVEGEIDICNAEQLVAAIRRLTGLDAPFVLDLRAVDFMAVSGFRELLQFAADCDSAHVGWHVVAGEALRPLLRVFADHHLPVVGSTGRAASSG